uniref:TTF-type domain-containing protein n=1 Tax=Kalanchoe fedtschenkoi TaxID=63787 RepID=A0A7N0UPV0_KALFE
MYKYYKRKTPEPSTSTNVMNSLNIDETQIVLENLPADSGLRRKISEYHPNIRDEVRRAYILKGPCQPVKHKFPQRDIGGAKNWLEYSIEKDAVFCLCCYLFRPDTGKQGSGESFVGKGITSWNKQDRLDMHVGGSASAHNLAMQKCKDLMKRGQHIDVVTHKRSDKIISSSNKRNFLELLKFLVDHNESIGNVVLHNAPRNLKLIAPNIQKDISNAAAQEGDCFAILIDESRDVSINEQMAVAVRYVNKRGEIIERIFGIVHVLDTTALSLKAALDSIFSKYNLTMSRVRGQGYDGASNMRGEFNGLKTLIMKENSSVFYVHCFAHQLQLTLVAVAKNHDEVASLFYLIGILTGVVGASCKRQDMLRDEQAKIIRKAMEEGELVTGRGLNQEINLKKAADTLILILILMKNVLGVANDLSQALQKKDQDIVNAKDLAHDITNLHHYRVEWYYSVIDMQILELNNRFDVTNTELLRCMSCLSSNGEFLKLNGISELSHMSVRTIKDIVYKTVYLL